MESAKCAARQLAQTQVEPPNTAEARRVATDLGVGRHVAVKLTSGKTVQGHLQAINDDHFVLLLDREGGLTLRCTAREPVALSRELYFMACDSRR